MWLDIRYGMQKLFELTVMKLPTTIGNTKLVTEDKKLTLKSSNDLINFTNIKCLILIL